jgi:hypothetical protein
MIKKVLAGVIVLVAIFSIQLALGAEKKEFLAADNRGSEHFDQALAAAYWTYREENAKTDPFILYTFPNESGAREALLELPCIHIAKDTGKMICTEFLTYGYYKTGDGYEAVLCGDKLTPKLWESAKASFEKHGGKLKNELRPEKASVKAEPEKAGEASKIEFVREDHQDSMSGTPCVYAIYSGPDEASAMAFLERQKVDKNYYYIVVETPDGNFCRDIEGIYKE